MSKMLKLPDTVYRALERTARENGQTPAGWIKARLPGKAKGTRQADAPATRPRTLYERLLPNIGSVHSTHTDLSVDCGKKFTEYLLEKKKAGRL